MSGAALKGAADFFSKTWKQRYQIGSGDQSTTSMLTKVIGESRASKNLKTEQVIRKDLLDTMAELSSKKIGSNDKQFGKDADALIRGLGKILAQKDQKKFFKQLEEFKRELFILEQKNKGLGTEIRESLDFERGEAALEAIEKEENNLLDTNLGKDAKTALINFLGPAAPLIHQFRSIKKAYGGPIKGLWTKFRQIMDSRAQAQDEQLSWFGKRLRMFRDFGSLVNRGLKKATSSAGSFLKGTGKFLLNIGRKGLPVAARLLKNAGPLLGTLAKAAFSRRGIGLLTGGMGLYRAWEHSHENKAQPVQGPLAPSAGTQVTQDASATATPQFDPKAAIVSATSKIEDAMSAFGSWFRGKWNDFSDWFDGLSITKDLKATWSDMSQAYGTAYTAFKSVFKAVPNMIKSVFRKIYSLVPTPIQKGIDWAVKLGGDGLKFFANLLSDNAAAELDNDTAVVGNSSAKVTQPGPTAPPTSASAESEPYPGVSVPSSMDGSSITGPTKQILLAMAQEYKQRTGKALHIKSDSGSSIEMDSADARALSTLGLLQKYGFAQTQPGNPGHLEVATATSAPTASAQQPSAATSSATNTPPTFSSGSASSAPIGATAKATASSAQQSSTPAQTSGSTQALSSLSGLVETFAKASPMDQGGFNRIPSMSKIINKTVTPEELTGTPTGGTMSRRSSLGDATFYIGDFAFLHLNFGMSDS